MQNTKTETPSIRLHGIFPFDRSGKARWLLTELDLPFEDRWLDVEKNENESAAFLELNPMGRTPVAEISGSPIFESGAICAYLADINGDKEMAPALTSPDRALYQQWMYFAASTLDPLQTRIMIIEDIPEGQVRAGKEAALIGELRDALSTLDRTLKTHDYLVGNRFTAADICVSYHLYFLAFWPELATVMNEFPRVKAYIERLKARPSAIKSKIFSYEE